MKLHARHLQTEIEQFNASMSENNTKMVDKWAIKPSLAEKLVDILLFISDNTTITTERLVHHFDFTPTTAKRYLRQLADFGYLEAMGGNKNRSYKLKKGEQK